MSIDDWPLGSGAAEGPAVLPADAPLRFVVLHHTGIESPHFDLMFENRAGGDLNTLRCMHWPVTAPTQVVPLPMHRAAYLIYEGPISNQRGSVVRVAAGTYRARRAGRTARERRSGRGRRGRAGRHPRAGGTQPYGPARLVTAQACSHLWQHGRLSIHTG